uniref:Uncharacterized protein n=1 Tax=Kalanchoe fedtschenkoi TaxID=63787 RepID=A0A7N0TSD9_KALFE
MVGKCYWSDFFFQEAEHIIIFDRKLASPLAEPKLILSFLQDTVIFLECQTYACLSGLDLHTPDSAICLWRLSMILSLFSNVCLPLSFSSLSLSPTSTSARSERSFCLHTC